MPSLTEDGIFVTKQEAYCLYYVCFLIAFLACIIGKICGMGGGVIIKPVLDAVGVLSISAINFLSGVTVLGMTCWSVGKSLIRRESAINLSVSTPLALGAAIGGLAGKQLFTFVAALFADAETAGGVQAGLLFTATLATLFYTLNKQRLPMYRVRNPLLCIIIGLGLGMLGTFLGIGGGPFNMVVLYFFFSMSTKVAAQNSLYIILISQAAGLLATALSGGIPNLSLALLGGMIVCGVIGGEVGGHLNRKLSEQWVTVLFEASMLLVMVICIYNMVLH